MSGDTGWDNYDATLDDEDAELAGQEPVPTLGWHEWTVVGMHPGSVYGDVNHPELGVRVAPVAIGNNPKSANFDGSVFMRLQLCKGFDGQIYPTHGYSVQLGRALVGDKAFPSIPKRNGEERTVYSGMIKAVKAQWSKELAKIGQNREDYKGYSFFGEVVEAESGRRYIKAVSDTPPADAEVVYDNLVELKV